MKRIKKVFLNILIFIIIFFLSLFVLEFVLRVFNYSFSNRDNYRLSDEKYVLNKETIIDYKKFYDDSYYLETIDSDQNIVALGDSFTEGYPVDNKFNYTEVLKNLYEDDSINIINMGIGNSSPDQHLRIFQKHILSRMKPDTVVWQFYPNDIWDSLDYSLFSISDDEELIQLDGRKSWVFKKIKLYRSFSFLGKIREKSVIIKHLMLIVERWYQYNEVPPNVKNESDWSLSKIEKEIKYMNSLAEENNFEVYYVLIAPQSSYDLNYSGPEWVNKAHNKLYNVLSKEKNFINADFSINEDQFLENKKDIFVGEDRDENPYGDRHYNEKGYFLLGNLIYQSINGDLSL